MMIRQFIVIDKRRIDFGQIYDGFFLTDGSGDAQCITNKGNELMFSWEVKLINRNNENNRN